jgi:aryl-alcohol dehydrogenase-like predicted oxidoreductase
MNYRRFGKTNWRVSEIGFGGFAIGGKMWMGVNDPDSLATVRAAFESGVNFFDTSEAYGDGRSEEILAEALEGRRHEVFIATKGGAKFLRDENLNMDEDLHRRELEGSLRRLRTDCIQLYQLHSPKRELIRSGEIWERLERFKQEGKIEHYGLSLDYPEDGLDAISNSDLASIQTEYNLLNLEPKFQLFPAAQRADVAIIARVPLCSGLLAGTFTPETVFPPEDFRSRWNRERFLQRLEKIERLKAILVKAPYRNLAQAAIKFAISDPAVAVTIPGAEFPERARENAGVSDLPPLSLGQLAAVEALYEALPHPSHAVSMLL